MDPANSLIEREPVRVIVNGLAAFVNLLLIALVAVHTIAWDAGQCAAVVAAVQAGCALVSEALRTQVFSPATVAKIKAGQA